MNQPTTGGVCTGAEAFAQAVVRRLRDLPASQRAEIERDVAERAANCGDDAGVVAQLGEPAAYADELRSALELPPFAQVRRRRRLRLAAGLVAASVAAVAIWVWQRDDNAVPADYPLSVAAVAMSGAGDMVGSTVAMPPVGEEITVSLLITNAGDHVVRLESVEPVLGAEVQGVFLAVGPDLPPLWTPVARVFALAEPTVIEVPEFDDPAGTSLPVTLQPGEAVVLQLRGQVAYCVEAEGGITEKVKVASTIDGEERTVEGGELAFMFGNCS